MADDRIYLRCKICKKALYLGKCFYCRPFYWADYAKINNKMLKDDPDFEPEKEHNLEELLNDFYEEHFYKCGPGHLDGCSTYGIFDIVYESDDDFLDKMGFRRTR